jgi:hypothetical protein
MTHAQALDIIASHKAVNTPDIQAVLKGAADPKAKGTDYTYTALVHAKALECGVDLETVLRLPQKQVKRFSQFLGALVHNNVERFDYTHARILIAMREAGSNNLTRDAVVALASGTISPSANTRGITRAQINALFSKRHNPSTVEAKVSNSTGANGFYQSIGLTYGKPGAVNREFSLNMTHKMTQYFFSVIDSKSEAQLSGMVPKEKV